MLRLSILTLSYRQAFDDGRMDLMSFLDTCRELSVEGVDLHDSAFPAVDRASLLAVKRECLDRGLDIPCIAISNNFARPAEDLAADVQRTKTWIERAALLGAPQVRVFSGKPFSEDDRAASWDRCADALRECAEFGAEVGVVVSLQNHNHNQIAPDGEDVLRLIRQVDHPNLGHVLDTGQYAGSPGASGFADDEQREAPRLPEQHCPHRAAGHRRPRQALPHRHRPGRVAGLRHDLPDHPRRALQRLDQPGLRRPRRSRRGHSPRRPLSPRLPARSVHLSPSASASQYVAAVGSPGKPLGDALR